MGRTQGRDPAADETPSEPSEDTEMPFETALERLEAAVDRLEQGDLTLEAALSAFEEGVALSRRCTSRLDAAERRIEVLTREGGQWLARPLDDRNEVGDAQAPDEETRDEGEG